MSTGIEILRPAMLTPEDLDGCISVLNEGEAVDIDFARQELPRSMHLAVKRDEHKIIALGAVKRQRPEYAADKAERAGHTFDNTIHEIGYIAVREGYRGNGLSHRILDHLLEQFPTRPLFATTFNDRMKSSLEKAGFERKGTEWKNPDGIWLSLWIKTTV